VPKRLRRLCFAGVLGVTDTAHNEAPPQDSANPFSLRVIIAMVATGALSFAAFIVLSAFADDLRRTTDGGVHALSKSAVGFAGVIDLLERRGAPVVISRGPLSAAEGLLILTPQGELPEDTLAELDPSAPTLFVLPKWRAPRDPGAPGWVINAGLMADTAVARVMPSEYGKMTVHRRDDPSQPRIRGRAPTLKFGPPLTTGEIEWFQTIESGDLTPQILDDDGRVVLGRITGTQLYILSDPDLLNTHGIDDAATAWAGVRVLESLAGREAPLIFDVTIHKLPNGLPRKQDCPSNRY